MPELDNLYGDGFLQPEEEKRRGLLSMLLGRGYQPPSPILHDMPVDPGFSPPPRTGPPIDPGFTGQPRTPQVPPALAAQSPGAAGVPPPLVSRASTKPVLGATPAPSVPPPLMTRGEAGPPMMRPDAPPILGAADRYSRYVQEAPQREDFSKYDLKPWQKILGGALATAAGGFSHKPELAGALGHQLFNRPEIKYQQAEGEYEKRLGQYKTAADVEREQAEETRKQQDTAAKANAPDRETLQQDYAAAVRDAIGRGVKPDQDPKVMQLSDAITALQKPAGDKTPPHITAIGADGKSHIMERNPGTGEYSIDRGVAPSSKDESGRDLARGDRSYQYHAGRIDKLREPVESRLERISRLEDTLNQGTPQADALIAPELLTVMAGGPGSGLRMNEAEIARIVGGRTNWETLKAKLGAWQTDPNKGFSLTPAQREQTRALFTAIKARVSKKAAILNEESGNLATSDDPQEHRRIYNRLQKRLSDIDAGTAGEAKGGGKWNPATGRYE